MHAASRAASRRRLVRGCRPRPNQAFLRSSPNLHPASSSGAGPPGTPLGRRAASLREPAADARAGSVVLAPEPGCARQGSARRRSGVGEAGGEQRSTRDLSPPRSAGLSAPNRPNASGRLAHQRGPGSRVARFFSPCVLISNSVQIYPMRIFSRSPSPTDISKPATHRARAFSLSPGDPPNPTVASKSPRETGKGECPPPPLSQAPSGGRCFPAASPDARQMKTPGKEDPLQGLTLMKHSFFSLLSFPPLRQARWNNNPEFSRNQDIC